MRVPALALLAALLLCGCFGTAPNATSSSTSHSQAPGATATQAPAAPAPFHVDRSGDLTGEDASGSWDWTVQPGFRTFEVELRVDSRTDVPFYQNSGFSYTLHGEGPSGSVSHHAATGGNGGVSVQNGTPPGCAACLGPDERFPGDWHLDFSLQKAIAHYSVHIEVTY